MVESERDSTQEWLLPAERLPPTVFELERRIDVALAVARASEAAALEIGVAALEAAEQAGRAAELAARASARLEVPRVAVGVAAPSDDLLDHFTTRADRVLARLRAIEQLPQRIG